MEHQEYSAHFVSPHSMHAYFEEWHKPVLEKVESITMRLVTITGGGPFQLRVSKLGVDDNDVVQKGWTVLAQVGQELIAWWIVAKVATGLRDHGLMLNSEDVETMCDRFKKSQGDADYVFNYVLSYENKELAHELLMKIIKGEDKGMPNIPGSRPAFPRVEELVRLDEALRRVEARC